MKNWKTGLLKLISRLFFNVWNSLLDLSRFHLPTSYIFREIQAPTNGHSEAVNNMPDIDEGKTRITVAAAAAAAVGDADEEDGSISLKYPTVNINNI